MDSYDVFMLLLLFAFVGCCVVLYIIMLPSLWKCINKAEEERERFRNRRNRP